jgi:ankyrin repeat protein
MNTFGEKSRHKTARIKTSVHKKVKFDQDVILNDLIKDNDVENVKRLLNNAVKSSNKIDLNKLNESGNSFYHHYKIMLINCTNWLINKGLSLLHLAVLENSVEIIRMFIEHGANINVRDRDSWTVLHASASMGHYEASK